METLRGPLRLPWLKQDFSQVYVLQGGLQAWQGASLPVSKAPEKTTKKEEIESLLKKRSDI